MNNILITSFTPFNNETINYSNIIMNELDIKADKIVLDVLYNESANKLIDILKNHYYEYIFLLGEARSRTFLTIEELAINYHSSIVPDNKGIKILDEEIIRNNSSSYKTNINLKELLMNYNSDDIKISYHAGTFICNELYYRTLDYLYTNNLNTKCIFIHIPDLTKYDKVKALNILKSIIKDITEK